MQRIRTCVLIVGAALTVSVAAPPLPADEPAKDANSVKPSAVSTTDERENAHLWKPRTKSVAVFKNGLGFFLRRGHVTARDGWVSAREIPPAKFGTLAIFSTKKDEMVDVVGSGPGEVVEFDGVDAPRDIEARRTRLEACLQLPVRLTYDYKGSSRTASGKLVSVGAEFAVLESDNNSFAVPVKGVTKLELLELPLRIHVASDKPSDGKKPRAPQIELGMAYLREGITWISEYSLEVIDKDTAELRLRGTLVNEAEDIIHCDVNFVVGVPHFAHSNYMAPIALGQVIRTIGAAVAPRELQTQIMNRAAFANNSIRSDQFDRPGDVVERAVGADGGNKLAGTLGNLPQLESPASSDYTVYTKKDLTVRRGERAIVTLRVTRIKYGHLYRWNPPNMMEHFLVLRNDTDSAWTTGPCLAVSAERPLSEDLIKYTPKGGAAELPVSAAINISHQQREFEVDRKFKSHSPSKEVYFDLVTLEGELRLKNYEAAEAEIVIATELPGRPIEASDDGVRSTDPTKLKLLERSGQIRWVIKLKPNETKTIHYKYERYVPAN